MNILWLGAKRAALHAYVLKNGDTALYMEDRLGTDHAVLQSADFIVSYGYRYIVPGEILQRFAQRAVNLHISFLPWNRGADPNVWSFLENSPKGVTIHAMNEGLDTGDILAQRELVWTSEDTLRSTYERLSAMIEALFIKTWPALRSGTVSPIRQPEGGSVHRRADLTPFQHLLTQGWDTPVSVLLGKAAVSRGISQ